MFPNNKLFCFDHLQFCFSQITKQHEMFTFYTNFIWIIIFPWLSFNFCLAHDKMVISKQIQFYKLYKKRKKKMQN